MAFNDYIDDMSIEILAQWGRDCIECANSLNRYLNRENFYIMGKITVCTGICVEKPTLPKLIDKINQVCFKDINLISELLLTICNNPMLVVDNIWKECANTTDAWDSYFKQYYDIIKGLIT